MNGWIHSLKVFLSDYNHGTSVHPRPLVAASPTVPASGWRGPMLCAAGRYGSCLAAEGVCLKSWSNIKENWLLQRTSEEPWCVFKVKNCFGNPILFATVLPRCFSYTEKNVFKHKKGRWPSLAPAWLRAVKHCRVHWAWESKVRVLGHVFWRFWKCFWEVSANLERGDSDPWPGRNLQNRLRLFDDFWESHFRCPTRLINEVTMMDHWIMVLPNSDTLTTYHLFPGWKNLGGTWLKPFFLGEMTEIKTAMDWDEDFKMMGHHGVKVELQDVDPGGWWFPGGNPWFFRGGEKKFGWCLGGRKRGGNLK